MSLQGNLADLAVVDLLQFVHLSGRSGTLHLERDDQRAHISFNRGRIVGAYGPASPSVCELMIADGALRRADLDAAIAARTAQVPAPPLGQVLITRGAVTAEALRAAITRKVEQTVFDLVTWSRGRFGFVVDEIRGDDEIALTPGDVIPQLDINTQMVLMEALRLFDERDRTPTTPPPLTAAPTTATPTPTPAKPTPTIARTTATTVPPAIAPAPRPAPPTPRAAVQLVTADRELAAAITTVLGGAVTLRVVATRDAGAPAPGEPTPIVVVDCRPGGVTAATLGRLRGRHPAALFVAIVVPGADAVALYAAGAAAALPPSSAVIAACCLNLSGARPPDAHAAEGGGLARLRRVIGDVRGGLLSATMSLNLMTIVAESVDRAVLFAIQRETLVGLGAFGARGDGGTLADTTRGLSLAIARDGDIAGCLGDGRARAISYDSGEFPAPLRAAVDRPRTGHGVLFPVLGSRRVVALIYADNGAHLRPIDDVDIVELATAQVGLAFENELLRRQLERTPARSAP